MLGFIGALLATVIAAGIIGYSLAALVTKDDDDLDSFL